MVLRFLFGATAHGCRYGRTAIGTWIKGAIIVRITTDSSPIGAFFYLIGTKYFIHDAINIPLHINFAGITFFTGFGVARIFDTGRNWITGSRSASNLLQYAYFVNILALHASARIGRVGLFHSNRSFTFDAFSILIDSSTISSFRTDYCGAIFRGLHTEASTISILRIPCPKLHRSSDNAAFEKQY